MYDFPPKNFDFNDDKGDIGSNFQGFAYDVEFDNGVKEDRGRVKILLYHSINRIQPKMYIQQGTI